MTKRGYIQVRVSEEEKARWEGEAVRFGVSLSAWIRRRCNEPSMEDVELDVGRVMDDRVARRFVVPSSCPAPNTKKSFKPDFK